MEDYEEMASTRLDQSPAPRRRGRRWLLIGALAFAFMLALGVGAVMSSSNASAQAATLAQAGTSTQTLAVAQGGSNSPQGQTFAAGPRAQGQCELLTVSSVNGNTIVAKTSSGSSVTIHTTAS